MLAKHITLHTNGELFSSGATFTFFTSSTMILLVVWSVNFNCGTALPKCSSKAKSCLGVANLLTSAGHAQTRREGQFAK